MTEQEEVININIPVKCTQCYKVFQAKEELSTRFMKVCYAPVIGGGVKFYSDFIKVGSAIWCKDCYQEADKLLKKVKPDYPWSLNIYASHYIKNGWDIIRKQKRVMT